MASQIYFCDLIKEYSPSTHKFKSKMSTLKLCIIIIIIIIIIIETQGGYHWGDPDVDGRMVLRWIFGKWEGVETGWSWLRIGTDGGHM